MQSVTAQKKKKKQSERQDGELINTLYGFFFLLWKQKMIGQERWKGGRREREQHRQEANISDSILLCFQTELDVSPVQPVPKGGKLTICLFV